MRDIAEITRLAHDTGFEQGSMAACNAILLYLNANNMSFAAGAVRTAWEGGVIADEYAASLATEPRPSAPPPAILLTPPKMTREQARGSGYTGDVCTNCQGMTVKRNGSCLVCESCGTTTGCS